MRGILLFGLVALLGSCRPSTDKPTYRIAGKIGGIEEHAWIYLEKDSIRDSARINGGTFEFKGSLEDRAEHALLYTKGYKFYKFIWLEPNEMTIEGGASTPRSMIIKGSSSQDEDDKLMQRINPKQDSIFSIGRQIDKSIEGNKKDSLKNRINELQQSVDNIQQQFIQSHGDSPLAVDLLSGYASTWGKKITQGLYRRLSPINKRSKEAQLIRDYIALSKDIVIGKPYADLIQYSPEGKKIRLSEMIGRPLLIEFWASWCVPCRKSNPKLLKTYEAYRQRGFEILGISIDSQKAHWLRAIKEDRISWKQASELNGGENKAAKIYNISHVPSNFLLDANGIVIATDINDSSLRKVLDRLLPARAGSKKLNPQN